MVPVRILIAEDDFTTRSMLAAVLRKSGYEVVETADGTAAWEELKKPEAPGLAILDRVMPGLEGLEVVRKVRALETEQPTYIIMLTSRGEKADIIAGLDAGADDYISKPFHIGELRARIEVGRRFVEMQKELLRVRDALAHDAAHDPLTGLLNRRAILDQLAKELSRSGRNGDVLAVGMCDIDYFKRVNDTCGHQAGDDVLRGVSDALSSNLRLYDSVGRLGGEEFLVIAPMKPGREDPLSLFERIRSRVALQKVATRSGELSVTVSIGVVCLTADTVVDDVLGAADAALYKAKARGRNRVIRTEYETKEGGTHENTYC